MIQETANGLCLINELSSDNSHLFLPALWQQALEHQVKLWVNALQSFRLWIAAERTKDSKLRTKLERSTNLYNLMQVFVFMLNILLKINVETNFIIDLLMQQSISNNEVYVSGKHKG